MKYVLEQLKWYRDRLERLIRLHEEAACVGEFGKRYAELKVPQHKEEIEQLDRAIEAVEALDSPSLAPV